MILQYCNMRYNASKEERTTKLSINDSPIYTKNKIDRLSDMTTENCKGCRAAAFE